MDAIVSTILLLFHVLTGGAGQCRTWAGERLNTAASCCSINRIGGTAYRCCKTCIPDNDSTSPEATPNANSSGTEFIKHDPQPDAPKIKGIYVTAHSAGGSRMESLLKLLDDTALNSMVIDLKDDNGYITYPTQNPDLLKLGKPQKYIRDVSALMERLRSIKFTRSAVLLFSRIPYLPAVTLSLLQT